MSKARWTSEQFKKQGLVERPDGTFVPVKSLVAKKVDKLPGLITDLNIISMPVQDFLKKKEGIPMFNTAPNGNQNTVVDGIPPDFNACYTVRFKPMSVNEAWKGKRYRSDKYNAYKLAIGCLLPKHVIIPDGLLKVYYEFGLSSKGGDWDNPVKPLQDILQEAYQFNDSRIMEASIKKVIVPKGSEYIRFKIESLC